MELNERFSKGGIAMSHFAMLRLYPKEMDKLSRLWEFHKFDCSHQGVVRLEHRSGGIGTVTVVTCGCGKEMDVTDYGSW
jgi:hypothetical protein